MSSASTWLKENLFVAAAIALPVLVTALFMLATILPRYWVEDPRYDLLVAIDTHTQNELPYRIELSVQDGRLAAHAVADGIKRYYNNQELYRFDTAAGILTRIDLPLTEKLRSQLTTQRKSDSRVRVPVTLADELRELVLLTDTTAPDGYHFRHSHGRGAGLFGEVFGMGGRRQVIAVEKDGRVLDINAGDKDRYRYYYNVQFLGWIDR